MLFRGYREFKTILEYTPWNIDKRSDVQSADNENGALCPKWQQQQQQQVNDEDDVLRFQFQDGHFNFKVKSQVKFV